MIKDKYYIKKYIIRLLKCGPFITERCAFFIEQSQMMFIFEKWLNKITYKIIWI